MRATRHILGSIAASAVLVLCLCLPYLPGPHDALGTTLSTLAQLVGWASVVFVPLGALWLASEWRLSAGSAAATRAHPPRDWSPALAVLSLVVATLIAILVAFLAAFESGLGPTAGLLAISIWLAIVWRSIARRRAARAAGAARAAPRPFDMTPLYLVVVPLVVLGTRLTALEPLSNSARQRAIANSAELIADIERHRAEQGHYPETMLALHDDYEPQVMGVPRYHYARQGEAYLLAFEIMSLTPGTRELVAYNPRDEHALPSHDSDWLLWTPAQRVARPGHYAVEDTPSPHWKRFLFD